VADVWVAYEKKLYLFRQIIFYASLIISFLSWRFLPKLNVIIYPYNLAGWFFVFIGLILTLWSWTSFKRGGTTETFSESKVLITEGLFRFSRNPMYLGMFLVVFGAAVCFRNIIGLASVLAYLLILQFMFIPYEEEKNEATFGNKYLEYKKRVRRWL